MPLGDPTWTQLIGRHRPEICDHLHLCGVESSGAQLYFKPHNVGEHLYVIETHAPGHDFIGRQLNNLPKHIVSRTLTSPEWRNSAVIDGDIVDAVRSLKEKPGRELQVHGSAQLGQTLNEHRLVDEYRILMFPLVLGTGKRLFGDRTVPVGFETVDCKTTSIGAVALTLRPTESPATADFVVEAGVGTHDS